MFTAHINVGGIYRERTLEGPRALRAFLNDMETRGHAVDSVRAERLPRAGDIRLIVYGVAGWVAIIRAGY